MADYCASVVDFLAFRVVRLEANGTPDGGAGDLYVTETPISMQIQAVTTEGTVSEQKDGRGRICARKSADDSVGQYNLSLNLCKFEVELWEILFGGTLLTGGTGGTENIGWAAADPTAAAPFGVSVEAWAAAYDGEEQANFPSVSVNPAYIRYCFPRVRWTPGDETVQEGIVVQAANGKATPNTNLGPGPENDWPATLAGPYGKFFDSTLPTGACGATAATS